MIASIKASELQAATMLEARLVINDGKYEKWQALFLDQVKKATGLPWKDLGWTEKMARGENTHTLTFKIPQCTLTFVFTEDAHGYAFWKAFAKFKDPLPGGRKEPGNVYQIGRISDGEPYQGAFHRIIDNGKDLIASIVNIMQAAGQSSTETQPKQDLQDLLNKATGLFAKAGFDLSFQPMYQLSNGLPFKEGYVSRLKWDKEKLDEAKKGNPKARPIDLIVQAVKEVITPLKKAVKDPDILVRIGGAAAGPSLIIARVDRTNPKIWPTPATK